MDFRVLNYFLTVAQEKNISKAAETLHLTQPTLSKQLKALEEELGVQLFTRGNREITLTEDGQYLVNRGKEILSLVDTTLTNLSSKETVSGEIVIGGGETKAMQFVAERIRVLFGTYLDLKIRLYSGNADDVSEKLDKGGFKMKAQYEDTLQALYNLILNPATREWERSLLLEAKTAIENGSKVDVQLSKLEAELRPLALRDNLTPDVTDFYKNMTGDIAAGALFDFSKHRITDVAYQDRAVFAGGCFWCMVEPFENLDGIVSVLSGYTGGHTEHPTYDQVSAPDTGHVEAVEIIFDTRIIRYEDLVELYWQLTDPTDAFGQFLDRGDRYRPIIFVKNAEQRQIAETSKQRLAHSGRYKRPIVTAIQPATVFWPAENHHQQFYKRNPQKYKRIERARRQYLILQRLQGKFRKTFKKFTKKNESSKRC